ncbi:MAG: N-acetyltransferase [Acidobacteriota bacterium]
MSETDDARRDRMFISIDAARKEDVSAIIKISSEGGLSEWSSASYLAEIERTDSIFYTASNATGNIVGFLCGRTAAAPDKEESLEAWIYNVGVFVEYRERGVGSTLIRAFFDRCRSQGVDSAWLEVRKNNARAISFYRGHDFREVYSRANFYTDPADDALILSARINLKA